MSNTLKYRFISEFSASTFESKMNQLMNQGYIPLGGASVIHIPKVPNSNIEEKFIYSQALSLKA